MMPFEQCNCMALRRASRRITNFYDSKLAPTGLRVTQYAILALLREHGGVSVNSLARYLDLDRTTMGKVRPISSRSPDTVRVPRRPKRNQLRTRNRVVHPVRHATDHDR